MKLKKRVLIDESKTQLKRAGHNVEPMVSAKPSLAVVGLADNGSEEELISFIENAVIQALQNIIEGPYWANIAKNSLVVSKSKASNIRAPVRDLSGNEVIRPRDLQQVTGMSRTQIWRLEKAGLFVPKIQLSNGCIGYLRKDIERWLLNRQAQ